MGQKMSLQKGRSVRVRSRTERESQRGQEGKRAKNRKAFVAVHYWGRRVAWVSTSKFHSASLASHFFRPVCACANVSVLVVADSGTLQGTWQQGLLWLGYGVITVWEAVLGAGWCAGGMVAEEGKERWGRWSHSGEGTTHL